MPEPTGNEPTPDEATRLRKLLGEDDSEGLSEHELRAMALEDEAQKTSQDAHSDLSQVEEEFKDRIQAAGQRLDTHMQKRGQAEEKKRVELKTDQEDSKGLAVGLSVAYGMLGLPLAGIGIGFLLNKATGGTQWVGICAVAGAVLGIAYAAYATSRKP